MSISVCNFCGAELQEIINGEKIPNKNWDIGLYNRNIFYCKECLRTMFKFAQEKEVK